MLTIERSSLTLKKLNYEFKGPKIKVVLCVSVYYECSEWF